MMRRRCELPLRGACTMLMAWQLVSPHPALIHCAATGQHELHLQLGP